jgi:hypothetical protein
MRAQEEDLAPISAVHFSLEAASLGGYRRHDVAIPVGRAEEEHMEQKPPKLHYQAVLPAAEHTFVGM